MATRFVLPLPFCAQGSACEADLLGSVNAINKLREPIDMFDGSARLLVNIERCALLLSVR